MNHYDSLGQFSTASVGTINGFPEATTTIRDIIDDFSPSGPAPPITLDLTLSRDSDINTNQENGGGPVPHQNRNKNVEDYVAYLTGDRNFTLALAAAVARCITHTPT